MSALNCTIGKQHPIQKRAVFLSDSEGSAFGPALREILDNLKAATEPTKNSKLKIENSIEVGSRTYDGKTLYYQGGTLTMPITNLADFDLFWNKEPLRENDTIGRGSMSNFEKTQYHEHGTIH